MSCWESLARGLSNSLMDILLGSSAISTRMFWMCRCVCLFEYNLLYLKLIRLLLACFIWFIWRNAEFSFDFILYVCSHSYGCLLKFSLDISCALICLCLFSPCIYLRIFFFKSHFANLHKTRFKNANFELCNNHMLARILYKAQLIIKTSSELKKVAM